VIRKGLSLQPEKRFASASAFGNALTQAARNGRDWRRVAHPGHEHCIEGSAAKGRAAVAICTAPTNPDYLVRARLLSSGRRVANILDVAVKQRDLSRTLQQLVKKLG